MSCETLIYLSAERASPNLHEALGIFVHDVHRRWGSVFWLAVVGARHPRPPARNREAERRDPPPRPAARVRARLVSSNY